MWDPRTYDDTDYGLDPDESFEPENAGVEYVDVRMDAPHIMTVLGPIEPEELGITLVNERLLNDLELTIDVDADVRLHREDFASEEIEAFVVRGGRAIVEQSTRDTGRNAAGLLRLAMKAPVHLIGATGCGASIQTSRSEDAKDLGQLTSEVIADLQTGMDGTHARAGVISLGVIGERITDVGQLMIDAAAAAHVITGAPVALHPVSGKMALEQFDRLRQGGVKASQVIIGELDRDSAFDVLAGIARTGAFIAFDSVSKVDEVTDSDRATMLVRLIEAGYGDQLLLSHGHNRASDYIAYGGNPGLTYIIERFMLEVMSSGAEARAVRNMLVENPARALTVHPPAS